MMRYIKPPDFKSVKEFESYYRKIEQDIHTLLTTDGSANSAKELNEKISEALNAATSYLSKKNREFTQKELATAFQEGRQAVKEPAKVSAKEAAEILEKQGYKYAKNGLSRDTYIELQNATIAAGNGLKSRVNAIIGDLRKTGQDTVYNVQQEILKDLQKNGLMTVEYSNGARQPLHAYAAMAARSARIESANIGAIGRALQAGTDYVKMTSMPQCCKLCGAYQDKVYCISGKDKRFPALFKTVLRSGYALPHPNCRHEFIPWFIEMEDPADVEKSIENSKIKYDKNGNLVDVRYQKDIESYAAWQAGNRQLNREYLEYERMKAYYAEQGKEPPYKTLGAFRREVRKPREKQSDVFRSMRSRIAEEKSTQKDLTKKRKKNRIIVETNAEDQIRAECSVDWSAINTKKYQDGIISLTEGKKVLGTAVYKVSMTMLEHRQGTKQEDLYLLDARTGAVVYKDITTAVEMGVERTPELMSLLSREDGKDLIIAHNHPKDGYPSAADFNALYENPKIKYGIIVGHKGTIYKYTAPKQRMQNIDIDVRVLKFSRKGYKQQEAEDRTYKELAELFGFKMEVIKGGNKE